MRLIDLFLFGPPVVLVFGAWVAVEMDGRSARKERALREKGPAE